MERLTMNNQKALLITFAILLTGVFAGNISAEQISKEDTSKDFKQNLNDETETERLENQIEQLKADNNKLKKQVDDKKEKDDDDYYFKVWKSYEDAAMHFNDLIIRLRIQSIGGLAALAIILGIFLKNDDGKNKAFKYMLAMIALVFLIICWNAIWKLDMEYYDRLLEGSVNAILELENNKKGFLEDKHIDLSTNIERAFSVKFEHEFRDTVKPKGNETVKVCVDGRIKFYQYVQGGLYVLLGLCGILCVYQYIKRK